MKKLSFCLLSLALLAALLVPAQEAAAVPLAVELVQVSCTQDNANTNTTTLRAEVSGQICLSYEYKWENATPTSPGSNVATSTGGNRTVTVAVKCGGAVAYDSITLGEQCEI